MAGFRIFLLSLCAVCVSVGCVSTEGGAPADGVSPESLERNPIVLNGAEICGPIYDTLMYLGPKDGDGRLDMSRVDWDWAWRGHPTFYLPVPTDLIHSETFRKASSLRLDELDGRVASVMLLYEATREENAPVWEALVNVMKDAPGPPLVEEDRSFYRDEGRLHIGGVHDEEMEIVAFSMMCLPLRGGFLDGMESAPSSENGNSDAMHALLDKDAKLNEGFLGRTVLDVILTSGPPVFDPVRVGPDRLGMFFEGQGYLGTPIKEWIWFVDGKSAYVGWDFPPPFGPDRAVRTYFSIRREFIDSIGEPAESIGGRMDQRLSSRWRDGDIETALTLDDVDGFPWFRLEFIDIDHVEEVGVDFWVDRAPPEKHVAHGVDSGEARSELTPEIMSR